MYSVYEIKENSPGPFYHRLFFFNVSAMWFLLYMWHIGDDPGMLLQCFPQGLRRYTWVWDY